MADLFMESPEAERLKEKLKEIFQLDRRDLDFGIYRILNIKSAEVAKFLDEKLLTQVHNILQQHQHKESAGLQQKLQEAIKGAKAAGVNVDTAPTVVDIKKEIDQAGGNIDERAREVFSDLYNFFRRYYKEGDFLSLRRYKKDVYALPYEGEEVKLHWANADQYYIKSSEKFGRYVFVAQDKRIIMEIAAADVARDNNKTNGATMRYVPFANDDGSLVAINRDQMRIRFAYTATDDRRQQETINEDSTKQLLEQMPHDWQAILSRRIPTAKNDKRVLLQKHINTFTAKNTFDYFIHKNLRAFLRRELDFFIKNEVALLDDIDEATAPAVEVWLGRVRALRKVAHKLIDFLAQIENFQKRMWLKKKFVLATNYCATLGHLPPAQKPKLWQMIRDNMAQWEEWENLGFVQKKDFATATKRKNFMEQHPSLPIDTRHFDNGFKYQLLGGYDNVDEACDGVLFHGENFQALNLMQEKYRGRVKCVYIDPPYNTNSAPIAYKNNYKDSSWCTLMENRILMSKGLLSEDAISIVAIDDVELRYLTQVLDGVFGIDNYIGVISTLCNPQGRVANNTSKTCEFHILHSTNIDFLPELKVVKMENGGSPVPLKRTGTNSRREERPKRFYPILEKDGNLFMITKEEYLAIYNKEQKIFDDSFVATIKAKYENEGYKFWLPKSKDGTLLVWQREFDRVSCELHSYTIKNNTIYRPAYSEEVPKTLWRDSIYANPEYGSELLKEIIGEKNSDKTAKSIHTVMQMCRMNKPNIIIDYFAGSGTTAHAVINLNREDDEQRKFILVEMGEHFSTVLLPRIKKVIYAPKWKEGKPVQELTDEELDRGPRLIKYQSIESYEDALDNLQNETPNNQKSAEKLFRKGAAHEEYMLRYLLDIETQDSASLFNVSSLANPFAYHLNIKREGETQEIAVDLVETFNYLLGLHVAKIDFVQEVLTIEGQNPQGDKVLVVWRDTNKVSEKELNKWFRTMRINSRDREYDLIYINGDNMVENLRRADETWKVRMIETEFRRLLFEDTE